MKLTVFDYTAARAQLFDKNLSTLIKNIAGSEILIKQFCRQM